MAGIDEVTDVLEKDLIAVAAHQIVDIASDLSAQAGTLRAPIAALSDALVVFLAEGGDDVSSLEKRFKRMVTLTLVLRADTTARAN